jgi:hypothetical protein
LVSDEQVAIKLDAQLTKELLRIGVQVVESRPIVHLAFAMFICDRANLFKKQADFGHTFLFAELVIIHGPNPPSLNFGLLSLMSQFSCTSLEQLGTKYDPRLISLVPYTHWCGLKPESVLVVAEHCVRDGRGEDCWARSIREVSSRDDRPAISAMCRSEAGTRSLVVVMAWEANLDMVATNRAVDQSQQTSLRHLLLRFHSMILEDLVVATAASSVVRMVKLANQAGEVHSDRKGHWASS